MGTMTRWLLRWCNLKLLQPSHHHNHHHQQHWHAFWIRKNIYMMRWENSLSCFPITKRKFVFRTYQFGYFSPRLLLQIQTMCILQIIVTCRKKGNTKIEQNKKKTLERKYCERKNCFLVFQRRFSIKKYKYFIVFVLLSNVKEKF